MFLPEAEPNLYRFIGLPFSVSLNNVASLVPTFPLFLQLGPGEEESSEDYYNTSVSFNKPQCQVLMKLTFRKKGCFRACISYKDLPLSNGEFDIIVLSGKLHFFVE